MLILIGTAASIGFVHTLFGPDHYVPFVMMSWARRWSRRKTSLITILCGLGHVGSSILLGLIGVAVGVALQKLELLESWRGNLAGWALIAFGLLYFAWGLRRAYRNRPHHHAHVHGDQPAHEHEHAHTHEHSHVHDHDPARSVTPWALFVVFVLGPCEPLIPILMYPAAKQSLTGMVLVTLTFALVTIGTMLGAVLIGMTGVNLLPLSKVARFTHALAGASICLCGLAMQFLGL